MKIISKRLCLDKDTGLNDIMFGGILFEWIDEVASIYAIEELQSTQLVTRAVNNLNIKNNIKAGDIVEIGCETKEIGNTSITISVFGIVKRIGSVGMMNSFDCELTFVQIDNKTMKKKAINKKPLSK